MHKLSSGVVSPDTSVIVDFSLTGNSDLLLELFVDRMLVSDFVQSELAEADIHLSGPEIVRLESDDEWNFFVQLRRTRSGLGIGEIGALTVARFRNATLLTNDKPARQTAETLGIPYSGGIGVLEFACESGNLSGEDAVQILDAMIEAGARISIGLVSSFRRRVLGRPWTLIRPNADELWLCQRQNEASRERPRDGLEFKLWLVFGRLRRNSKLAILMELSDHYSKLARIAGRVFPY